MLQQFRYLSLVNLNAACGGGGGGSFGSKHLCRLLHSNLLRWHTDARRGAIKQLHAFNGADGTEATEGNVKVQQCLAASPERRALWLKEGVGIASQLKKTTKKKKSDHRVLLHSLPLALTMIEST